MHRLVYEVERERVCGSLDVAGVVEVRHERLGLLLSSLRGSLFPALYGARHSGSRYTFPKSTSASRPEEEI